MDGVVVVEDHPADHPDVRPDMEELLRRGGAGLPPEAEEAAAAARIKFLDLAAYASAACMYLDDEDDHGDDLLDKECLSELFLANGPVPAPPQQRLWSAAQFRSSSPPADLDLASPPATPSGPWR